MNMLSVLCSAPSGGLDLSAAPVANVIGANHSGQRVKSRRPVSSAQRTSTCRMSRRRTFVWGTQEIGDRIKSIVSSAPTFELEEDT